MSTAVERFILQRTSKGVKVVDVISIREIAELLGIKVYKARTLEWDGAFGKASNHRKPGRKGVWVPKAVVLQYKQDNPNIGGRGNQPRVVSKAEVGQDVIHSCEVVSELFHDSELAKDTVFIKKLDTGLARFTKQGESLVYE